MSEVNVSDAERKAIWPSLAAALGAELRPISRISGLSGIEHNVESVIVDDKNKRLIVVSAEPNPRTAALLQSDIQATLTDVNVILARPIAFDVMEIIRHLVDHFETANFSIKAFNDHIVGSEEFKNNPDWINLLMGGALERIRSSFVNVSLPPVNQLMAFIYQLSLLDWSEIRTYIQKNGADENLIIPLSSALSIDSMEHDRKLGICPFPLYEFSEVDWDLFLSSKRVDEVEARLKALGIYQFFFPPADQLVLGLAERASPSSSEIVSALTRAMEIGHPIGQNELIDVPASKVRDVVDYLSYENFLVEGELTTEITEKGFVSRSNVKFRPREGFVSKLISRMRFNFSATPKDFM